jgi:hypothetical protein
LKNKEMAEISTNGWQLESLRATAFPSPDVQFDDPMTWWNSILVKAPDSRVDNMKLGTKVIEGTFKDNKLILTVAPARVDWSLAPNPQPGDSLVSSMTIGSPEEQFQSFLELLTKWFPLSPVLNRLALGATAHLQSKSKTEAYQLLQKYLPAVTLDENSSDFIYRINRPRESNSGIKGLTINRVSTWMAIRVGYGQFALAPHGGMKGIAIGQPVHACRVELDINTAQEYEGSLMADESVRLFRELIDSARQILKQGDIS